MAIVASIGWLAREESALTTMALTDRAPGTVAPAGGKPVARLSVLLVAALAVRGAYIAWSDPQPVNEMAKAALCLVQRGYLGDVFGDDSGPTAHVAPLYPLLLSGLGLLFGLERTLAWRLPQLLSTTVAVVAIGLTPLVGSRLELAPRTRWLAAFLLALAPTHLWVETSASWEQPWAVLCLMALAVVAVSLHREGWKRGRLVVALGVLTGVLSLLSPALLPAGALIVLGEAIVHRGKRSRVLGAGALAAALGAAIMAPWVARNHAVFGAFVPLRSNFGLELRIGNNEWSNGKTFATDWTDETNPINKLHPFVNEERGRRLAEMGEIAFMREQRDLALRWIGENPRRFLELCAIRARLFWLPPDHILPGRSTGRGIKTAVLSTSGALGLLGLGGLFARKHPYRWLVLALMLGPSAAYLVTHVDVRYRLPVQWLTWLVALDGLESVVRRVSSPIESTAPRVVDAGG